MSLDPIARTRAAAHRLNSMPLPGEPIDAGWKNVAGGLSMMLWSIGLSIVVGVLAVLAIAMFSGSGGYDDDYYPEPPSYEGWDDAEGEGYEGWDGEGEGWDGESYEGGESEGGEAYEEGGAAIPPSGTPDDSGEIAMSSSDAASDRAAAARRLAQIPIGGGIPWPIMLLFVVFGILGVVHLIGYFRLFGVPAATGLRGYLFGNLLAGVMSTILGAVGFGLSMKAAMNGGGQPDIAEPAFVALSIASTGINVLGAFFFLSFLGGIGRVLGNGTLAGWACFGSWVVSIAFFIYAGVMIAVGMGALPVPYGSNPQAMLGNPVSVGLLALLALGGLLHGIAMLRSLWLASETVSDAVNA